MTYIVPSEALNSTHSDTMMGTSRKRVVERLNLFTLKLAALISSNKFQEMPKFCEPALLGNATLHSVHYTMQVPFSIPIWIQNSIRPVFDRQCKPALYGLLQSEEAIHNHNSCLQFSSPPPK